MLRVDYARWGQTPEDLRRLATSAPHQRTRERFLALYEVTQASCATRVATRTRRHPQTVMEWLHRYNTRGPEALTYRRTGGRPSCMRLIVSRAISVPRRGLWNAVRHRDRPRRSCAAVHRTTLYPVGPRRVPDQRPTCVGECEAGRMEPIFLAALWPWGAPVHTHPASSRTALGAAAANSFRPSGPPRPPGRSRRSRSATTRRSASSPGRPA